MGWSSGSAVFSEIIGVLKDKVEDIPLREEIYEELIPIFENSDCDTLDECLGTDIAFDTVFKGLNPDIEDEEYETEWEDNDYESED